MFQTSLRMLMLLLAIVATDGRSLLTFKPDLNQSLLLFSLYFSTGNGHISILLSSLCHSLALGEFFLQRHQRNDLLVLWLVSM